MSLIFFNPRNSNMFNVIYHVTLMHENSIVGLKFKCLTLSRTVGNVDCGGHSNQSTVNI
jgi:hypothetical protein